MRLKVFTKVLASLVLASVALYATPHHLDKSHTNVGFSVKHLMITNVRGKFNDFDGKVDFDHKSMQFNALSALIKTASINTENQKRDDHLRSPDFFNAAANPQISFVMNSYKGDKNGGVMSGDITIKNITKSINLDVEMGGSIKDMQGNNRVGFVLNGRINRGDFDLKWNKALEAGGVVVGEEVKLIIEVEAIEN